MEIKKLMKYKYYYSIITFLSILVSISLFSDLPLSIFQVFMSDNNHLENKLNVNYFEANAHRLLPYKNNFNLADSSGRPNNDSVNFYPLALFPLNKILEDPKIDGYDTFFVKIYSRDLHKLEEPILYNHYLDKEIFRFIWMRSFRPSIIIRMEKEDDSLKIIQKLYHEFYNPIEIIDPIKKSRKWDVVLDSVWNKKIIKKHSLNIWNELESKLIKYNYLHMSSIVPWMDCTDGAEWFLEGHLADGYYLVNRWCPGEHQYQEFRKLCDFILDQSEFKHEKRY